LTFSIRDLPIAAAALLLAACGNPTAVPSSTTPPRVESCPPFESLPPALYDNDQPKQKAVSLLWKVTDNHGRIGCDLLTWVPSVRDGDSIGCLYRSHSTTENGSGNWRPYFVFDLPFFQNPKCFESLPNHEAVNWYLMHNWSSPFESDGTVLRSGICADSWKAVFGFQPSFTEVKFEDVPTYSIIRTDLTSPDGFQPIPFADVTAVVSKDPTLRIETVKVLQFPGPGSNTYSVVWSDPESQDSEWIHFNHGVLTATDPSRNAIEKMKEIGHLLDARVQKQEGGAKVFKPPVPSK